MLFHWSLRTRFHRIISHQAYMLNACSQYFYESLRLTIWSGCFESISVIASVPLIICMHLFCTLGCLESYLGHMFFFFPLFLGVGVPPYSPLPCSYAVSIFFSPSRLGQIYSLLNVLIIFHSKKILTILQVSALQKLPILISNILLAIFS